jgi:hypothetical protein
VHVLVKLLQSYTKMHGMSHIKIMLVTCKEVHLEINTEKTECMLMSREHTA